MRVYFFACLRDPRPSKSRRQQARSDVIEHSALHRQRPRAGAFVPSDTPVCSHTRSAASKAQLWADVLQNRASTLTRTRARVIHCFHAFCGLSQKIVWRNTEHVAVRDKVEHKQQHGYEPIKHRQQEQQQQQQQHKSRQHTSASCVCGCQPATVPAAVPAVAAVIELATPPLLFPRQQRWPRACCPYSQGGDHRIHQTIPLRFCTHAQRTTHNKHET